MRADAQRPCIAVAWGLPCFSQCVPALNQALIWFAAGTAYPDYLPVDNRASAAAGTTVRAVIDAIQFPSDSPPSGFPSGSSIRLEANHVELPGPTTGPPLVPTGGVPIERDRRRLGAGRHSRRPGAVSRSGTLGWHAGQGTDHVHAAVRDASRQAPALRPVR